MQSSSTCESCLRSSFVPQGGERLVRKCRSLTRHAPQVLAARPTPCSSFTRMIHQASGCTSQFTLSWVSTHYFRRFIETHSSSSCCPSRSLVPSSSSTFSPKSLGTGPSNRTTTPYCCIYTQGTCPIIRGLLHLHSLGPFDWSFGISVGQGHTYIFYCNKTSTLVEAFVCLFGWYIFIALGFNRDFYNGERD